MRHANKKKRIGRNASHRKATLQALSTALIRHKRIETTLAKAKALRPFVEPILHRAHDDSTASRRQAFRKLQDKEAVKTLYGEIAPAIDGRPGGYTRIVKLGQRAGDAAEMAMIEIVDFNDVKPEGSSGPKRKTRRSRRRSGGSAASAPAAAAAETAEANDAEAETPEASGADEAPETEEVAAEAAPAEAAAEETAPEATEDQEAEAVASDAANPVETGNPQVPQGPDNPDHGDAEQGAAPGTGEPPPEAQSENQGRSGEHRG